MRVSGELSEALEEGLGEQAENRKLEKESKTFLCKRQGS